MSRSMLDLRQFARAVIPASQPPLNRRDLPWLLLLLAVFVLALAVSWQRWGDPLIDRGREMNLPLRLASGEMLYSDVRFIYAPLSPYFNAALYRAFGPSLNLLYLNGILTTAGILALLYTLSRRQMSPPAATLALLGVVWLCAFKPAGNFIFPYSYSALHACLLGLLTLSFLVRFLEADRRADLFIASLLAGVTLITKTEFGAAALFAGVVTAALAHHRGHFSTLRAMASFALPPLVIAAAVYSFIAARVGWHTLTHDSFLFFTHVPPELAYFNLHKFGFDRPLFSLAHMILALLRLAALGGMIAAGSLLLARRGAGKSAPSAARGPFLLLFISLLVFVVGALLQGELGPFVAMPLILIAVIVAAYFQLHHPRGPHIAADRPALILIVLAAYALACLARAILRVPSGGAYGSYLLPVSVILFVYVWLEVFPRLLPQDRAAQFARRFILGVLMLAVAGTAVTVSAKYRKKFTYELRTARGTMLVPSDHGVAFSQAMALIEAKTSPADTVAIMPEGTALNFFTGRRNPLRDEIAIPGILDAAGEDAAFARLAASRTRLILIANRSTEEFGPKFFGLDYNRRLMAWIEQHYAPCGSLGPDPRLDIPIGHATFFFRAFCRTL